LDAGTLLLPLMALDRIRRQLAEDCLVHRYEIGRAAREGLPGREGFFSACTFWLVEAMAGAGQAEEAQLLFEKMLSFANHLGLYAEEIGSKGELLGNFPQALTHLALVSAAYKLDRVLDEGTYGRR